MNITIFGKGNMAQAIDKKLVTTGNTVQHIGREADVINGDIVVLAVPYMAVHEIIEKYQNELAGKIIIDITNPVDFATMDRLVIPHGTSAAEIIQNKLPNSFVVKAFNTNFAATLASGFVAKEVITTVQLASDFDEAKTKIKSILQGSGLKIVDAGNLKRARELEALGMLSITLAVRKIIDWNGGFSLHQ